MTNKKKQKKAVLIYKTYDEGYMEAEGSTMAIQNNNTVYIPKEFRRRTYSVLSTTKLKPLFTGPTRKACKEYIEKRTGKKVVFEKDTF